MGIGQLTKLFEAVVAEHPEIAVSRSAVQEIDRLRTTWITRAVTAWPVDSDALDTVFRECTRAIHTLLGRRNLQ